MAGLPNGTTSCLFTTVPAELQTLIASQCDPASLARLARVHSIWKNSVQESLYRDIRISIPPGIDSLQRAYNAVVPPPNVHPLPAFQRTLTETHSYAPCIRLLDVHLDRTSTTEAALAASDSLCCVLPHLVNIQYLFVQFSDSAFHATLANLMLEKRIRLLGLKFREYVLKSALAFSDIQPGDSPRHFITALERGILAQHETLHVIAVESRGGGDIIERLAKVYPIFTSSRFKQFVDLDLTSHSTSEASALYLRTVSRALCMRFFAPRDLRILSISTPPHALSLVSEALRVLAAADLLAELQELIVRLDSEPSSTPIRNSIVLDLIRGCPFLGEIQVLSLSYETVASEDETMSWEHFAWEVATCCPKIRFLNVPPGVMIPQPENRSFWQFRDLEDDAWESMWEYESTSSWW